MVCQNVQKSLKDTVPSLWWVLPSLSLFFMLDVENRSWIELLLCVWLKAVHCYEHPTLQAGLRGWRAWVNPKSECFMAVCGHSLNFHVATCTSCSLCNKDLLCFLLELFTQMIVCAALSVLPEYLELHKFVTTIQGTQQISCALPLILLHYSKF